MTDENGQNGDVPGRVLEFLSPVAELVSGFADIAGEVNDPVTGMSWTVSEIRVDLPIEMEIRTDGSGRVVLAGAPPTQQMETTFFPLLHRLRLGVVAEDGSERE